MASNGHRYILAVEPARFGPISLTLAVLVEHLISNDRRFNANGRGIRAGARILEEFKTPRAHYKLHPDDWKLLAEVAEAPGDECGYPTLVSISEKDDGKRSIVNLGARLIPFLDAISNAATEEPIAAAVEERALS